MQSRVFLKGFAMESLSYNAEVFGLARHCAGFSMRADGITRGGNWAVFGANFGAKREENCGKMGGKSGNSHC
jgi:hypothetical protein